MFKSYVRCLVVSVACVADIIYCQLVTSAKPCQFWAANPNVFRYSLQPDWHTDNGIFKRPIVAHMQVLVPRWATGYPEPGFQCCLTEGLNQKFGPLGINV